MAGKISDADSKIGNKLNSNMVKISSSKSILSYQNGSALNFENRECTTDEGMPADGYSEETSMSEEALSEAQNLKSECLDILRKKLISDLSLTVFSTDLENKLTKMEPIEISKERQSVVQKLVIQISQLSDAEKLLLYLKLPSSTSSPFDPLRQPLNPLGNRQEIQQTIVWIKTHLEEDSEISIPKQDVYDQYLKYCENVSMKPLSTADFGKVMKQVYPGVRPRRLGTRGNSRYCYSGMRNTCKLPTPILPQSSVDGSVSNGSASDGLSALSTDGGKYKKMDKAKRKWKSSACRNDKCTTSNRSYCPSDKDLTYNLKNAKRTKVEDKEESESVDSKRVDKIKEEVDLGGIKCEENSDNSFNAFDIECGLGNDFGIYFEDVEKVDEDSGEKQKEFRKILNESQDKLNVEQARTTAELGNGTEGIPFSSTDGDQTAKTNVSSNHIIDKINGIDGGKHTVFEHQKQSKAKMRRSTSFSKTTKNFKKCYVPIQPKPIEPPKLNVRFDFEQPIGMGQFPTDHKKESNGMNLCDESDSQEPEEEIVRYFKHLDASEITPDGLVDQAVKNIESSTVQISSISQIVSKNPVTYGSGDKVLKQTPQQLLRSQSCFEVHRGIFNVGDSNESVFTPRSQSSVELPTKEQTQQEVADSDSCLDGKKKKISHLRILLEKSISSTTNPYSNSMNNSLTSNGNPVMSNAQITDTVNQTVQNGHNFLLEPAERDLLRLNGLKILSKGPSFVPQSPNTRTKYFSFTPISPGPQSPLKTPSTPSASPFVSPRNTPVPRSRQNSHNDRFVSPSDRKSGPIIRNEFPNENVFNFSKIGSTRAEGKPPTYLQACRPRSFSSTNFCRSKARRSSSKLLACDRPMNVVPKNQVQIAQNNFSVNPPFSINRSNQNFFSNESISSEVQKFLENSKLTEGQAATIRSQSVPLNRMISESTWMPAQVSPVYAGYFNSGNPSLPTVPGKFSELVSNSDTNSLKDVTTNMASFVTNRDITNLGSGSLSNEVFSTDPSMVQLNDQYFSGDFQPANEENFSESEPFGEESAFSNKLDLNSSGTFDSAFTSDSDPAMSDNIKSYLPNFEGLDNKGLVESSGSTEGVTPTDRKLFKNVLYEGGNDNLKDPVITSFKPVLMNEMSSSPVLNFFGTKMNEDNPQLIEFFDFED